MNKFTKNSSYKVIRITDDSSVPLTFETYYKFEKRNFDIINLQNDDELIETIYNNKEVDAIVIQFKETSNLHKLKNIVRLPEYYKRRTFVYDTKQNYGIDLAIKISENMLNYACYPKFSFITPLYETKFENFKKTYKSLCGQSIDDWEWVLVDDSPEPLEEIKEFLDTEKNVRVKYFRIGPTDGNIGLSKWRANCMSTGRWLIELDHDDLVFWWTLKVISEAIEKYPNNKFIYSDNTTIDEKDMVTGCRYGENYKFGLGYGHSYMSKTPIEGKDIRTDTSGPMNAACVRHIVGMPNHFRCWERDFYFSIGGHNQCMRIGDDYELLVRSFLKTRFTHIMACCYAQRFDGQNSQYKTEPDSDGQGNIADIQRRIRLAAIHYDKDIHERLLEVGLNDDYWIEGDPYRTAQTYMKIHPETVCEDQFYPFDEEKNDVKVDDTQEVKTEETGEKKKLGIFFLATSVYKDYFTNFSKSLKNLFPNGEFEKHLIILADGLSEYDGKSMFGCDMIHWKEVIDFPYPCVPMNKFQMVSKYMEDLGLDCGMFFDADTIIIEKSPEFWANMKEKLLSGKLLTSGHPHYLFNPNLEFTGEPIIVTKEDSAAHLDKDVLNGNKSYIITSFMAGTKEAISKYAKKIYDKMGHDLSKFRWVPEFVDEAYMNKIYVDEVLIGGGDDIIKEKYITINQLTPNPVGPHGDIWKNNFPQFDNTIFLNQKYNVGIKTKKKKNVV